ncbi:MAG: flagellar motor protein MotB, partial [Pseudomonadales bacterium]|nr:flagellar motor protein MotB [Pseudomonadales bacterium]
GSWVKVQQANSEGLVSLSTVSADGGFQFGSYDPLAFGEADASANRMDISVAANDFTQLVDGKLSLYVQDVEAGYSAPGLATLRDTTTWGGRFEMPVGERISLSAKVDQQEQDQGLETSTAELNMGYDLTRRWNVQAGVRRDGRDDRSPVVLATQETGDRTDAVVQVGYDPRTTWNSYMFVQETLTTTGNRRDNSRIGVGGKYLLSDKLELNMEMSDGDLGMGGRVGSNYAHSENTSLYLNYALENERTDNVTRNVRGSQGNLTAGLRSRLADNTSVFLEERYQHNEAMTGLTHATGITFAPTERWNLGVNTDMGTLVDRQTGAETERIAGGIQLGFNFDALQFASALEYRNDDSEQLDLTRTERTTWLLRNNFKYQRSAGSRLVGKLNHSTSESSLGTFYDGGFTEAVLGYAFRPVASDRLNAMVTNTYF